jgi:hypothetical protein
MQVAFPFFTVGAEVVQMKCKAVENIDIIDSLQPFIRYGQIVRILDFSLKQVVQGLYP